MSLLHRPAVQRWLGRHLLCRVEGVSGRFALTFDDGPSPRNTPRLLGVLERAGAHATFFLLDHRVRRYPELVRRLVEAGHEAGVHGRLHLWPPLMPTRVLAWELRRTATAIEAAAAVRPRLYRAPFGLLRAGQARAVRALGYEPVLGDIYPDDVHCRRPEPIVESVMARLAAGSIVILHDSRVLGDGDRGATVEAVDWILREAAARGLTATSVSDLRGGGR
jgi:peptidoglycan/xylan/chitin deacetylase (PgdA/CDA1 family)